MPRRKIEKPLPDVVLALPPPQVVTHKKHEHDVDPYQAPAGAVPAKVSNLETKSSPKKNITPKDEEAKELAKLEMRARAARYNAYLDLMAQNGGNQVHALAAVYELPLEDAARQRVELLADVRNGIGSTEIAKVLEENDLNIHARAQMLRKWAYSDIPAASLKALDMASELEGERGSLGSFEEYLRLIKMQKD